MEALASCQEDTFEAVDYQSAHHMVNSLARYITCASTIRAHVVNSYNFDPGITYIKQQQEKLQCNRLIRADVGEPIDCPDYDPRLKTQRGAKSAAKALEQIKARVPQDVWPCGHPKTWRTTQTVCGVERCRDCRRERWLSSFYRIAALKHIQERSKQARIVPLRQYNERQSAEAVQFARQQIERPGNGRLPMDAIVAGICKVFSISEAQFFGKGRARHLVAARSVLVRILRDRLIPYPAIGRVLKRDHSTIINAEAKFSWYDSEDPRVGDAYLWLGDRERTDAA